MSAKTGNETIMIKKLLIVLAMVSFSGVVAAAPDDRPNILFAMADDWGWPHAGAYGDKAITTPNFDRIAREGVLFNHAYVTSPSCTASRNSVITGKYPWELGPGANLWSTLPVEHESFIHLLADNGYITGRDIPKTWGPGDIASWTQHHGEHPAGKQYGGFAEFLSQTKAREKPFFFWLATSGPHRGYERDAGINSGIDPAKVHLFGHFPDSDVVRRDVADYYFEVQRWDLKIGDAITVLEEHGLLDNTIIIISGDNGMPFPRGKGNLYDSGVRVPLAIRWGSKVKLGRHVDDFISFADIAPTLLELTGVAVPKDMTGVSFANLLISDQSGMTDPANRSQVIFGRERHKVVQKYPNPGGYPSRGLRTHEFLYIRNYQPDWWPAGSNHKTKTNVIRWHGDCDPSPTKSYIIANQYKNKGHRRAYRLSFSKRPTEELYDLNKDPDQIKNQANDSKYSDILKKLRSQLQKQLDERNDPRATDPLYYGFDAHPYLSGAKVESKL
jgi:N-sulfoglucosamine sulfohydrolase